MNKIFVHANDADLYETLAELESNVELCQEHITFTSLKKDLNNGDIVFWDRIPPQGFYGSNGLVVVVGSSNNKEEEFAAAKAGAHGFIYPDLPANLIIHVIGCIARGEIWMTRETIARVFDEYTHLMENLSERHK